MKKVFLLILPAFLIFTGNLFAGEIIGSPVPKKTTKAFSNPGDYFRSFQTGDWGDVATWESSSDNNNWFAATLTPDNLASAITIRNTHIVTVSTNQDMDDVSIESGGVLFHSGGTLTVNNGLADDIVIQSGGIFTLASNSNPPSFAVSATVFISPGAVLRVTVAGLTAANPAPGVNASNFVYSDASVLELNTGFSTDNVTYFPNVNASTIPIFKTTNNLVVGANSPTVFNGIFEAAGGTITFQNTGTKTFRNGITGISNVNGLNSGKFIINGDTAILGGSGTLALPNTDGMDIGTSATVTMTSDKLITSGNITLLSNTYILLGTHSLTTLGTVNGGSLTSHIVTNGTGKLILNNIVNVATTFPIGATKTTYNPIAYNAGGGGLNYGIRVEIGINPSIAFNTSAVNRTWFVTPSGGIPGTVDILFFYSPGEGNASFLYNANLELGINISSLWNVIQTGLTPINAYQVAATVSSFNNNTEAPLVLGNLGAILAVNNSITLHAQKQNEKILLNWTVIDNSLIGHFIAERSVDGRQYSAIGDLFSSTFNLTDIQPLPGLNYYRIKMIEKDGKVTYSNTVAIPGADKGIEIINITPNPIVNGHLKLNVSAAQNMQLDIVITDMQGRLVQKRKVNMTAGFNAIPVNVTNLAAGIYHVYGNTVDGRSRVLRFVVQ